MAGKIVFCNRCRGMKVGWNKRFVFHWLLCREWRRTSSRLGILAVLTAVLLLAFPERSATVFSADRPEQPPREAGAPSGATLASAAVRSMNTFLAQNRVSETNRRRLAESIVASAKKYNLDPKLIASVLVVESRGNPFAISDKDAIGIMQIHLGTWGERVEREGVNLFKIEDNVDFGARILGKYVRQYGVWEGVKRYNGFIAGNEGSERNADGYAEKVRQVYGLDQLLAPTL